MAFFNGQIHSVPKETMDDLSTVLAFLEARSVPEHVAKATANLLAYMQDYQLNEQDHG